MDRRQDQGPGARVTAGPDTGGAASGERRAERAALKRAADRRGLLIAAISTIVVIGGLVALILTSPGWPTVKDLFFNVDEFKQTFPTILKDFWLDIRVFLMAEVAILFLGLIVALVRISTAPALFPLRLIATLYADLFRGIPTILLVYLIGFGVPAIVSASSDTNNALSWLEPLAGQPVLLGGIALTISYGAYVSEVYRAGLHSVHSGQREAALAVGLTERQAMRHVVLPQAVSAVGPPLLNDFIALQKDVALLAILGVSTEAFARALIYASTDFNYTPMVAAALLYIAVTVPLARLLDVWERRRNG